MGACSSCEATAVAAAANTATAKVVFMDGQLHQFLEPTRASQVVKIASASGGGGETSCFLCSADELELGGAVAAVAPDEELQAGQLYFVLPAGMLRRRLQAEEMAALAVKASAALVVAHDGPLVFPAREESVGITTNQKSVRRSRRGSSRGRDFVSDLGAIAE